MNQENNEAGISNIERRIYNIENIKIPVYLDEGYED